MTVGSSTALLLTSWPLKGTVLWRGSKATTPSTRRTERLAWAQQQIVRGSILTTHLCQVESATVLAANRWIYTVKQWVPAAIAGSGISNPTDDRFKYTTCRNIREEHNTATLVDGMDITTPAASVGPVGSVWSGAAWTTTNLAAKLLVHVVYDLGGNAYAFFDRPNPIRCTT